MFYEALFRIYGGGKGALFYRHHMIVMIFHEPFTTFQVDLHRYLGYYCT